MEAQFTTGGITTQKTKFDHIVASLVPEFATEVRNLILNPPRDNPYTTLKEQLVKQTAISEQQKLQQLFNTKELGDRKPSQLYMQQLLGDKANNTDGAFMRELFLQWLPSNVHMVLTSTPDTRSLNNLTQLADKIEEVATPSVSSVHTAPKFQHLRQEVEELNMLIQTLKQPERRFHGCSPSPAPPRQQVLCWYHNKFDDNAKKCKPPCDKLSENFQASR